MQALDLPAMSSDNDRPLRRAEHWQDMDGRAKDLGVVWTLRKGPHTAICVLQGHPLGTEGRVLLDGDLHQTQAFRNTSTMIDTTTSWREAFKAKGWAEQ